MVAIILAIVTRRVIASLGLAVVVGAALLAWKLPLAADEPQRSGIVRGAQFLWHHIYQSLFDADHISVLQFSLLLGAMIGVLEASRSMQALMRQLAARASGRRGGQTLVAGLGLGIFFDDYANTLLLGGTMRSVCDTLRISRAKLAYLVDSTAAPVAGLALVSTWVATEVSLIGEGLPPDSSVTAFELFVQSIAYRFYPIFALLLVFIIARSGRDFGPMLRAERAALEQPGATAGNSAAPNNSASPDKSAASDKSAAEDDAGLWVWFAALLPVVVCVATVAGVLVSTGLEAVADQPGERPTGLQGWGEILGNADSYQALTTAGKVGLLTALVMGFLSHPQLATLRTLLWGVVRGAWQIMPAMLVLWLAWALSSMTAEDQLNTGGYLGEVLSDRLPGVLLPTLVFLVASLVAFSTGTSWGTMALLTPLAVQLGLQMAVADSQASLLAATTGSVLAGAIFGDHCSPISDTTVLSSRACGCDHVEHVRTQMPYAALAAAVAILLGTLPAAWGLSPWLSIVAGAVVLYASVRVLGRRVEEPSR
ncbi:Na+/H+ antiporter NhaC family protein [Roseimaritima ulvae]|uniref:Malate-2H(+)/Na(+)-lactate antiporter n=2 Tax=Roseimaritima ulvae TaxID=980254 RepID=A0A5B9QW34_9BACT|nr:Na+/H+ antiporter NhaC family protein [Roseimaritima ulvae]QEG43268.1 Malate-2H(+)/Na(+)-lactate antiporter [Roseimaritima ulvae]